MYQKHGLSNYKDKISTNETTCNTIIYIISLTSDQ